MHGGDGDGAAPAAVRGGSPSPSSVEGSHEGGSTMGTAPKISYAAGKGPRSQGQEDAAQLQLPIIDAAGE